MEDDSGVPALVGICVKCDGVYMVAVDKLDNAELVKENAKEVAKILKRGDRVERKTVGWVRAGGYKWHDHDECKKSAKKARQPAMVL